MDILESKKFDSIFKNEYSQEYKVNVFITIKIFKVKIFQDDIYISQFAQRM